MNIDRRTLKQARTENLWRLAKWLSLQIDMKAPRKRLVQAVDWGMNPTAYRRSPTGYY